MEDKKGFIETRIRKDIQELRIRKNFQYKIVG